MELNINDKVLFRHKERCILKSIDTHTYSIPAYILDSEEGYKLISFCPKELEVIK